METKTWNIDTAHSSIGFSIRHMVVAKVRGRFGAWNSQLTLDAQDLTRSKVTVDIDASSIDTGVNDRDNHLRSADFFDVARFPTLRFVSNKIEKVGGDRYKVHGDITIRDVTRPITLELEHGGQAKDPWGNQRAVFTATTSLSRGEFGLKWNQALEAGGVLVGDRVDIELEVQAVQAAATQAA